MSATYDPTNPAFIAWCRQHYELMREGGVWAVPRSGLMFTKRDGQFVLTAAMPWTSAMEGTITAAELAEQQEDEYLTIRAHFGAAGIEVVRSTHAIDCDMSEDCTCGFDMNDPGDCEDAYRQLDDEL